MRIVATDLTSKERVASVAWLRDSDTGVVYTGDAVLLAILNSMRMNGQMTRRHVRKAVN